MVFLSSSRPWIRSTVLRAVNNRQSTLNSYSLIPRSLFSTLPSIPPLQPKPPEAMNKYLVRGVQDGTSFYIQHGVGQQRLIEISKDDNETLVIKWQRCMEAFLGVQVHVMAGLGYKPDENGITLYNQQVAVFLQDCAPDIQEEFRIKGRDTWREVLGTAFSIDLGSIEEVSIVDARNIMHKVSQRMQEQDILDKIAKKCAGITPNDNPQIEMAQKHHMVQEVLVHDVYLGGDPKLVSECGFGEDEIAYVRMQMIMAEHSQDPLISQYVGMAMMHILKVAGLDVDAMRKARGGT